MSTVEEVKAAIKENFSNKINELNAQMGTLDQQMSQRQTQINSLQSQLNELLQVHEVDLKAKQEMEREMGRLQKNLVDIDKGDLEIRRKR